MVWRCFIPSGRSFIIHWWLFQNTFGLNNLASKPLNHHLQRVTTECLISVLPLEKNSVSFNSLLHLLQLLKVGLRLKINSELLNMLEELLLSWSSVMFHISWYRIMETMIMVMMRELLLGWQTLVFHFVLSKPIAKLFSIGRLIYVFLTLVARDENLGAKSFQSLAEALPKDARYCDDNLTRAMDMYPMVQKFFCS